MTPLTRAGVIIIMVWLVVLLALAWSVRGDFREERQTRMSLFRRAYLQFPLTPAERAFLKALKGLVLSALMAGATAVWPLLQSEAINWRTVIVTGIISVAFTLCMSLDKYWTAQGDTGLAGVAGAIGQALPPVPPVAPPSASPAVNPAPAVVSPAANTPAPATATTVAISNV